MNWKTPKVAQKLPSTIKKGLFADGAKWTKDNLCTRSVDKASFCTRPRSHQCRYERSLIGAVFFLLYYFYMINFCNLIGLEL